MGKRIIPRRRGRGSPRYRSPSHRFRVDVRYPPLTGEYPEGLIGQIVGFVNDPGRSAPLAKILLENFKEIYCIASDGVIEGDLIRIGGHSDLNDGDILPVGEITEGTPVYNIEIRPGDGGKLVRSSGSSAYVVSHEKASGNTYIRLPSKKTIVVNSKSRATVGKIAGGGRKDKAMVHAGQNYHARKARNKVYPKVKGVSMNAVDHPHGGSHSNIGKASTVSRNAPPGRKVGHIAAKRTGKRKR